MSDNSFIDTNLLIYCYTSDEPEKSKIAQQITLNDNVIISTQVLSEFTNVLKKKFEFDWNDIEIALNEIIASFNVYINKATTIEYACQIGRLYHFSFYDSLIIASALLSNCKILYSEDMQHNQLIENKLTIINPFID
jgi:predicted nucleic acid-binding protein